MSWLLRRRRRIEFAKRRVPAISRSRFENPLFPKVQRKGVFNGRGKYYFFILVIGFVYFVLFSNLFTINSVLITGINYLTDDHIRPTAVDFMAKKKWFILPQNNLIFSDTEKLKNLISEKLKDQFALSSLEIKKNYPDTLEIKVDERIPSFTWVSNNITYYVDLNGKATKRLEEGETIDGNFPKIYDLTNQEIKLNDPVISPGIINYIFTVISEFHQKMKCCQVADFQYDPAILPDLWLKTKGDWRIFLDTGRSPADQINEALLIINEYFSQDQTIIDYIDVRIEDRVYYKTKF